MASVRDLVADVMASANGSARGWLSALGGTTTDSRPTNLYIGIATALFLAFLINVIGTPRVDPREPPVVKSSIPFIGHIIGLMRFQSKYHVILRRKNNVPIATLPMLNGKMYAVWDPILISAALKNKQLSSTPHLLANTQPLTHISDEADAIIRGPDNTAPVMDRFMAKAIPSTLKGEALQMINAAALETIGSALGGMPDMEEVPNLWLWVRGLMTSATSKAAYGPEDPFSKDSRLEQMLWDFEADITKLLLNRLPSILAPAGHRARNLLTSALVSYYTAKHDTHSSVSAFVKIRAQEIRSFGFNDDDLARVEIMLPFAATTNTVPTLFWFICFVFSRPDIVARLRKEVQSLIVERQGEKVTVALGATLEENCPLLVGAYRETMRLTNHQVSTRTALQDVTLSDSNGNTYLLKKDAVVQLAICVSHALPEYWGEDASEFRPDRFLEFSSREGGGASGGPNAPGSPKAMRLAYLPFGGGLHLCPGRNFAYAELMGVMVTMLLGYEIEPLGGKGWNLPGETTWSLVDAVTKPLRNGQGFGVRIRKKEGWEGVEWKYQL